MKLPVDHSGYMRETMWVQAFTQTTHLWAVTIGTGGFGISLLPSQIDILWGLQKTHTNNSTTRHKEKTHQESYVQGSARQWRGISRGTSDDHKWSARCLKPLWIPAVWILCRTGVLLCVSVCVVSFFSFKPEPIDSPQAGAAFCQSLQRAGGWMDYSIVTCGTQRGISHCVILKPVIRKTRAWRLSNHSFLFDFYDQCKRKSLVTLKGLTF